VAGVIDEVGCGCFRLEEGSAPWCGLARRPEQNVPRVPTRFRNWRKSEIDSEVSYDDEFQECMAQGKKDRKPMKHLSRQEVQADFFVSVDVVDRQNSTMFPRPSPRPSTPTHTGNGSNPTIAALSEVPCTGHMVSSICKKTLLVGYPCWCS
jgi:hypothetical protein